WAAVAIGAVFHGVLSRLLQLASASLLFVLSATVAFGGARYVVDAPPELLSAYPLAAALVAVGYGGLVRERWFYYQAAASLAAFVSAAGLRGDVVLPQVLVGLDHITLGLPFFVLAALISLKKAGRVPTWLPCTRG